MKVREALRRARDPNNIIFALACGASLLLFSGLWWLANRPNGVSQEACESSLAVSEYRYGHHGVECVETDRGWCFRDTFGDGEIHC
jgi:hypothetical protein